MNLTGSERDEGLTHNSDAFLHRKEVYNFVVT